MVRSTDTWRRAVALVLVLLCFLAVPQVAHAVFKGTQKASAEIGTARIFAPTALAGTWECRSGVGFLGLSEGIAVNIGNPVEPEVQAKGLTYQTTLVRGGTQRDSGSGTPVALSSTFLNDLGPTTWVVTVQATVGRWTGPVISRTLTCDSRNNNDGSL